MENTKKFSLSNDLDCKQTNGLFSSIIYLIPLIPPLLDILSRWIKIQVKREINREINEVMKKNSIAGKILYGVLIVGAIYIAASSPYFAFHLPKAIYRELKKRKYFKAKNSQFNNAFYYLKRKGYLNIERKRGQIYISLTEEGKKKAKKYQIDNLKIEKPKKWDGFWRIVIFDISILTNIKRAALRGILKNLGFLKLQQSVWIFPYDCQKEIELLREFFGLTKKELRLIVGKIEEDESFKKYFNLS